MFVQTVEKEQTKKDFEVSQGGFYILPLSSIDMAGDEKDVFQLLRQDNGP